MAKVLVVDDHAVVRQAILGILSSDPRSKVLGNGSDFSKAITKAQKSRADVLVVDLHMPLEAGLSSSDLNGALNSRGGRISGISFANDEDAKSLPRSMGAVESEKTFKEIVSDFPVGTWLVISGDGRCVMAASDSRVGAQKLAKDKNGEFLIRVPQINQEHRRVYNHAT